jgi:hypothetical protein
MNVVNILSAARRSILRFMCKPLYSLHICSLKGRGRAREKGMYCGLEARQERSGAA